MITGASPRSIFPPTLDDFLDDDLRRGRIETGAIDSVRAERGDGVAVTALGRSAMTAHGPEICSVTITLLA